jgi:hypothetical protein
VQFGARSPATVPNNQKVANPKALGKKEAHRREIDGELDGGGGSRTKKTGDAPSYSHNVGYDDAVASNLHLTSAAGQISGHSLPGNEGLNLLVQRWPWLPQAVRERILELSEVTE